MKQFNTIKGWAITMLALFFSTSINADTHTINSGSYYYSPSSLTISLGDTVNWYNDGGFHNVNADINAITGESYNNPESFVSAATGVVGELIYSHVFTIPGEYNYDCSIGSHAANGMVGTINVEMTNDISTPPFNAVNITFRVNMQDQDVNPSGVYMAGGSASAISGGGPPGIIMNDDDGDGFWEVTIPLQANGNFTWKFRNGFLDYWDGAPAGYWEPNFNGLGCGFGQWGDRILTVPTEDTTFDFCFASCDEQCPLPDVDVLFSVNVADFPDPVDSVQIQGTFIGWTPGNVLNLENTDGTIWTINITLPANSDHEFRYIVNDQIEVLPGVGSCVSADPTGEFDPTRIITTDSTTLELPLVCYASCLDCGEGVEGCTDPLAINYDSEATVDMDGCLYNVDFAVDMTGYNDVSIETINVNGTFNEWCGTCNELYDDDGDNIYTATIPLPAGPIEYLYTVNGWEAQEVFGEGDDCVLVIPDGDITYYNRADTIQAATTNTMPVHCFSTCNECITEDVEVVFSVDMSNEDVSENGVFLTGSFDAPNNFTLIPMTDVGNGIYEVSVVMTSTIEYIYRFANGGFANSEDVSSLECNAVNGYRGLTVTSATNLPTVCFNSCSACDGTTFGCTDEAAENYDPNADEDDGSCTYCCDVVSVDFTVDMNGVDYNTDDYTNVVINGSWNGWNGWGVELFDEDGDGIWTGSGEFDPTIFQFEYVVAVTGPADNWSGWGQQWGNGCANSNFLVLFEEGVGSYSQSIEIGCEPVDPTVFTVDMNCADVEFETVHLTGPLWGWTTDIIMSDEDGDGVYSITMENLTGEVEYKYMVDYWASQEDLVDDMIDGATCAPITDFNEYANRLTPAGVTTADTYGSCDDCDGAVGCTDSLAVNYNPNATEDDGSCDYCFQATINFSVRADVALAMSNGDFDNVLINGNWDAWVDADGNVGWNSWGVTLTDDDSDGIYTGSISLDPGDYQYVHALTGPSDSWSGWGQVGNAPDECALGIDPISGDSAPNYFFSVECGETLNLPILCFGECDDCTDGLLGCTDANADNYDPNATEDDGSCTYCGDFTAVIFATTDATTIGGSNGNVQASGQGGSSNYDVNVFDADGIPQNPFALSAGDYTVAVTDITSSCISEIDFTIGEPAGADPCDVVPTGLTVDNIIHNRITFNWSSTDAAPSHYMIRYRVVGTTDWTVISAGPINTTAFNGTSRTRYFMEPGTTYEWSMRARVLNEDLTINCQSDWSANSEYTTLPACPNLDNLSVSTEANWVTFFADAPSGEWGVWQSKGKMRELGANNFRYVNGDSEGNINGLKGNFTASTDYEWHTKAWCTGNVDEDGNSDPMYHSGWGDFSAFSTEAACDKMPMNLTTSSNGANTAVIMSWDTPESGAPDHYFLEMTNVTTGAVYEWNDIPGTATSQTKFNQNPGDEISWRIRGACGTNGTSWATIFSQPVTYTLGGERVAAEVVSGLDVYPNPSRDIFNISFSTKTSQTVNVQVVNLLGEVVYTEELVDFEGYHQTLVDMNGKPKGVYFLEITTLNGSINQKIVLQ